MSMFLVGRHTRAEEESGRDELLARRARRPVRADDRRRCWSPCSPTWWSGLLVVGQPDGYGLAVPDSIAPGLGLTLCGWFFTGTALSPPS